MYKEYGLRKFFDELLESEKETDEFAEWAFGKDFRELAHGLQFLDAWNSLHVDHVLDRSGIIAYDAPKMIMLYRAHKATQSV